MVRLNLQYNRVDNLGRVVLLVTPNQGSEAADHFSDSWLIDIHVPTAKALGTGEKSFPKSLIAPYYPIGIIFGERKSIVNDPIIPGDDDGLVSIEATKIDCMTDFIILEVGHSMMRYVTEVAEQAIEFAENGALKKITYDQQLMLYLLIRTLVINILKGKQKENSQIEIAASY